MNTKNAGITLIELIIVLALLGMAVSAAALSFSVSEKRRLSLAMTQVQSDLRYIRKISLNESVYTRIVFRPVDSSYLVQKKSNGGEYKTIKTVKLEDVKLNSVNSPGSAVEYTSRATTGDACTIVMSTDKYKGVLTVNVGAGRVRIKEITKK